MSTIPTVGTHVPPRSSASPAPSPARPSFLDRVPPVIMNRIIESIRWGAMFLAILLLILSFLG